MYFRPTACILAALQQRVRPGLFCAPEGGWRTRSWHTQIAFDVQADFGAMALPQLNQQAGWLPTQQMQRPVSSGFDHVLHASRSPFEAPRSVCHVPGVAHLFKAVYVNAVRHMPPGRCCSLRVEM